MSFAWRGSFGFGTETMVPHLRCLVTVVNKELILLLLWIGIVVGGEKGWGSERKQKTKVSLEKRL